LPVVAEIWSIFIAARVGGDGEGHLNNLDH